MYVHLVALLFYNNDITKSFIFYDVAQKRQTIFRFVEFNQNRMSIKQNNE